MTQHHIPIQVAIASPAPTIDRSTTLSDSEPSTDDPVPERGSDRR
ncbi:MAG: hypothetical protein ACM37W_00530 [Actinomycetota bacterium]